MFTFLQKEHVLYNLNCQRNIRNSIMFINQERNSNTMMTLKKSFILILCICLIMISNLSVYAHGGESAPCNPVPFEDQIIEILLDCDESERQSVIDKAVAGGISIEDLSPYLAVEDLEYMSNKQTSYSVVSPKMIPMLNVPAIMQQCDTWCGAATAQIVLTYLNGTSPSQSTIVDYISNSPSIDAVTAYINNRITSAALRYTYRSINVSTDFRADFNIRLATALQSGKPMILQIANPNGLDYWPYQTSGHYCLCDGTSITYSICDPYYFDDYVDIPYDGEEGHFITEWSNIENAIIAWANKGANVGYTSY